MADDESEITFIFKDDAMPRLSRSMVDVGGLELLARYSMNKGGRTTSVLSSLHEFRVQEAEQVSGKQWNWKYLRDQFSQKELEGLYRKYDNKLRETLLYIYTSLLVTSSTLHITLVIVGTYQEDLQWKSTYVSMAMYAVRVAAPTLLLWKGIYDPLSQKKFWIPTAVTFLITVILVVTDITVVVYTSYEGFSLRPTYGTFVLISVYIFLPMRNNYLAIILGGIVSLVYILVCAFITYVDIPYSWVVSISDIIYMIGVNVMGIYFRLMNEIVTRRSFLDRRACVESTLRLKFVKDQEERLMLSILPEHIVSRVRTDIRNIFLGIQSKTLSYSMTSFNQLYVEEHENVSILYADVVNYTMISTTLSPMRMVELLNELFGRFDDASEEHDVLRIKFLGDCYYCVSGIPKASKQHAKNCVDLGLEMIQIIKDVRDKRSLDINMRIGVHSGKILSGLIGIRKWQYDIWSKDVTIASKMESTGKSGKVHITKQTLELLLDFAREYIIEPNFESQNHPFIVQNKLETYLISRPSRKSIRGHRLQRHQPGLYYQQAWDRSMEFPIEFKPFRRASVGLNKLIQPKTSCSKRKLHTKTRGSSDGQFQRSGPQALFQRSENRTSTQPNRRGTSFMDENLVEYQQMLKAADAQMAKEIEDVSNGMDNFKKESRLNRITLMYKDLKLEKQFLQLPDPLFKYYITCCFLIFLLISMINVLTTRWYTGFHWYTWAIFGLLLVGLTLMQPLTWFQFLWMKYKGVEEPNNIFLRRIYDTSVDLVVSAKLKTLVYMVISIGLATFSVTNVLGCTEEKDADGKAVLSNCISSWHVTECWTLVLLLNFLFSRIFYLFKWIVAGAMTIFYLWILWELKSDLFSTDATWNIGLDPRVAHTMAVVFITIALYWIDRTTEFRNRLDHLWQIQLGEEQQEAETMLKVNNMLLENILPAHVVQVYLDLNRSLDELYYEKFENVAVMFASLTDVKLGFDENSDLSDKVLLSLLDEVISGFDRLLLTDTSAYKVEKVKMAGWTYMAACGIDPTRRESFDSVSYTSGGERRLPNPVNKAIVLTMVEFAAAIMKQLKTYKKKSIRVDGMNLRIGISNGEVAAGVVGSLKPLYDIWGHAVNMASRMDSTGETGKIQVTQNTAFLLDECGILTSYRGEIFVKGAGYIKTYFVPLDEEYSLISKDQCDRYYEMKERERTQNSVQKIEKERIKNIDTNVEGTQSVKNGTKIDIKSKQKTEDRLKLFSYGARRFSVDDEIKVSVGIVTKDIIKDEKKDDFEEYETRC